MCDFVPCDWIVKLQKCAVQEHDTPSTERIGIFCRVGVGVCKAKTFKEMYQAQ